MKNVEKILADHLIDNNIDNVFRGSEKRPSEFIPVTSVFVIHFGTQRPRSFLSGGKGDQHQVPEVQVMVRSDPENEEESRDLVYDIYDILRDAEIDDVDFVKVQSGPLRLGADDDDIYRWTINVEINFIS